MEMVDLILQIPGLAHIGNTSSGDMFAVPDEAYSTLGWYPRLNFVKEACTTQETDATKICSCHKPPEREGEEKS